MGPHSTFCLRARITDVGAAASTDVAFFSGGGG